MSWGQWKESAEGLLVFLITGCVAGGLKARTTPPQQTVSCTRTSPWCHRQPFDLFSSSGSGFDRNSRIDARHHGLLTKPPCPQEDAPDGVRITLPGHADDNAACHDAEQGRAHPEAVVPPNTHRVHSASRAPPCRSASTRHRLWLLFRHSLARRGTFSGRASVSAHALMHF